MKKHIRLLIENLFDDIYDINQKDDLSIEIANEHLRFYNFHPKNFNELKSLLKKLLNERGNDADLNDIDVSNITTFYDQNTDKGLFEDLDPHDIEISYWDVSNVENMNNMFYGCKNFTGQGLENWNVNNVENMSMMFFGCKNFNANLSNWKVDKVKDMYSMFSLCKEFIGEGLENWNIIKVNDMRWMFSECEKFDCDLSNWKVNNVENMYGMFYECKNFTGQGLEKWNVNNVENMTSMFNGCISLKKYPSWYVYRCV